MEVQAWVAVAVGVMAILSGLYAAVRFIVRSIMAEIGPEANGASIKEQVNRLVPGIHILLFYSVGKEVEMGCGQMRALHDQASAPSRR